MECQSYYYFILTVLVDEHINKVFYMIFFGPNVSGDNVCLFQKISKPCPIPTLPPRTMKGVENSGCGVGSEEVSKPKRFKEKYEAKWKVLDGEEGGRVFPPLWGLDIFWNYSVCVENGKINLIPSSCEMFTLKTVFLYSSKYFTPFKMQARDLQNYE